MRRCKACKCFLREANIEYLCWACDNTPEQIEQRERAWAREADGKAIGKVPYTEGKA